MAKLLNLLLLPCLNHQSRNVLLATRTQNKSTASSVQTHTTDVAIRFLDEVFLVSLKRVTTDSTQSIVDDQHVMSFWDLAFGDMKYLQPSLDISQC